MNKYIALFRGINVGGKNILPMKELIDILENMGLKDIKTYIQSGNVVFQKDKKKSGELGKEIGLAVKTGLKLPEICSARSLSTGKRKISCKGRSMDNCLRISVTAAMALSESPPRRKK